MCCYCIESFARFSSLKYSQKSTWTFIQTQKLTQIVCISQAYRHFSNDFNQINHNDLKQHFKFSSPSIFVLILVVVSVLSLYLTCNVLNVYIKSPSKTEQNIICHILTIKAGGIIPPFHYCILYYVGHAKINFVKMKIRS